MALAAAKRANVSIQFFNCCTLCMGTIVSVWAKVTVITLIKAPLPERLMVDRRILTSLDLRL